jgi:uncharacterized protein (TIGR02453 family)
VQCRLKRPEVGDQIARKVVTFPGFGPLGAGESVGEELATGRPMAIQRSACTAARVGHAYVRNCTDSFGQKQLSGRRKGLRTGSLLARVGGHLRRLWRNLRHLHLWRKLCHMSKALSVDAPAFFAELEHNNNREFWVANKARYDGAIRPSFLTLLSVITGFGEFRTYRPNNDTRFGSAHGAYKTFIGAVAERPDGVGVFVQISAKGLLVGSGIPMPPKDQLNNLRRAIDDAATGAQLADAMRAVQATGATVHGGRWEPLKRVPKGFAADHRRCDWLRWKGLEVNSRDARPSFLDSTKTAGRINDIIERGRPLHDWLGRHVGPTALTPEERFAPKRR